jgi:hypothetical protein
VDIILIEPEPDDELMFGTSILDYSARLKIAKHGFESVTHKLARDYQHYKEIAGRHGLEISARRVKKVLDTVEEQEEKEGGSAWRRVLEQTTGALLRQSIRLRRTRRPPTPALIAAKRLAAARRSRRRPAVQRRLRGDRGRGRDLPRSRGGTPGARHRLAASPTSLSALWASVPPQ